MRGLLATTALSASLFGWAQIAHAADEPRTANAITDIVVTAQKRSENIQQVPIAITAVSSQFLQSRGISSIDSLGTMAPNLTVERAPGDKTISQIAIRGSVTINPAVTWEPAVGLYLNGVYIAKAQGSIFDVADLERVEVLRGPQGTLYGRNALAGAINLVPRAPSGKLGVTGEVTYGNYNYWKEKLILDLPSWGPFSLKLSGQLQNRDGFIQRQPNPYPQAVLAGNVAPGMTDTLNGQSAMAQLRFHPEGSNVTADYVFDYSNYNQQPQFAQLYRLNNNGDPRDIFTNPAAPGYAGQYFPLPLYVNTARQTVASLDAPEMERSRTYGHALTLSLALGSATIKSITATRNMHWKDTLDLDGSPLPVATTTRDTHLYSFSQELQLTGKALDSRLNYVAGLFYYYERASTSNPQSYFDGSMVFASDYGSHTRALAAFSQADYAFNDAFKLTLGARYTHEQKAISRFYEIVNAPAYGVTSPTVVANIGYGDVPDAKYDSFTPAATLSFRPARDLNFYARYAKGFKSGGFNGETSVFTAPTPQCPSGAPELCTPYKPETVDSFEVGAKTKWFSGRLTLNLSAFWDEHKNIQLSVFTAQGAAASQVLNAAQARIRGLELEAAMRPVRALTISGSLSYLDPRYISFLDGGVDVSNNRAFPHAPHYTASLNSDWQVAQGQWGELHLIGDMSHVSSYYTYPYALRAAAPSDQVAGNSRAPARTLINLRANLANMPIGFGKADLSLWVKNVANTVRPSNFIDFGAGFGGLTVAYFTDPRTYGLTLSVKL